MDSEARRVALPCLLALLGLGAPAAEPVSAPEEVLEEVLVTGEQPGPAMWKVTRDGHTLWIMGTLAPLPARMTWRSQQVEDVIRRSGEILGNSTASASIRGGMLGALRYVPAALRLRHNPDRATLREVLPPAIYARWSAMHRRVFGKEPAPKERARPFYAADLLQAQALEESGLSERDLVWNTVAELAKRHKVRIRQREFTTALQDPGALITDAAKLPRDKEIACLVATLDYIDHELPKIRRRAEAWAIGDIAALRRLPAPASQRNCAMLLIEQPKIREQIDPLSEQMDADRRGAFDWMLLAHETSFTAMPIEALLDGSAVARWRAAGDTVVEPQ
jgi:uncharacterized protein YbaP (TraB family)